MTNNTDLEARRPEPGRYIVTVGDYVVDTTDEHRSLGQFTKAEAEIIAFALNAVAQGWDIYAEDNSVGSGADRIRGYEGPTEGVSL